MTEYAGSCLCKTITFTVTGFSDRVANCHCTMCRKFHGAAFGTLVAVEGLTWLTGLESLQDYVAGNGTVRSFCVRCGASLGFRESGAGIEQIELAIATFDDALPVSVDAQIYTRYKANWCDLHEDVPAFSEGRE